MNSPAPLGFSGRVDDAHLTRLVRGNVAVIGGASLFLAAAALGVPLLIATGFGSWVTVSLCVVLGVLAVASLVSTRSRIRMLRTLASGSGVVRVDHTGIQLPSMPTIRPESLVFVCVTSVRRQSERRLAIPVLNWGARAALRAGAGMVLCELGVHHADALRNTVTPGAHRLTLYSRLPDGSRRGTIPLLVDAAFDEEQTQQFIAALFTLASDRHIPHAVFDSTAAALRWKLPLLDPTLRSTSP